MTCRAVTGSNLGRVLLYLSGSSETPVQRGRTTRLKTRDVSVCKDKAQLSRANPSRTFPPFSLQASPTRGPVSRRSLISLTSHGPDAVATLCIPFRCTV